VGWDRFHPDKGVSVVDIAHNHRGRIGSALPFRILVRAIL
jgi:hypothetical protein